jgi:hypothetical protein
MGGSSDGTSKAGIQVGKVMQDLIFEKVKELKLGNYLLGKG